MRGSWPTGIGSNKVSRRGGEGAGGLWRGPGAGNFAPGRSESTEAAPVDLLALALRSLRRRAPGR